MPYPSECNIAQIVGLTCIGDDVAIWDIVGGSRLVDKATINLKIQEYVWKYVLHNS